MCLAAVLLAVGSAPARAPHRPHTPHAPRSPRTPGGPPDDGSAGGAANQVFVEERAIDLPGRGAAVSWDPDGTALALGGHFVDRATGLRYDTRVYDAASGRFLRSFACHHYWVTATTWTRNPFLGDVIVSGGADHAVRVWDADAQGSTRCAAPGQFLAADGGIKMLPNVNGWTMGAAFSPDGRYLAGASRDRIVRIWQIAPGAQQWKVVVAWMDRQAGNILSVVWAPDGRALFTGDRKGRAARWDVDPDVDRWDADTIAEFSKVGWEQQIDWFGDNPDVGARQATWLDGEHGDVWNVRVSPSGDAVAATGDDGTVSAFDAATGAVRWRYVGRSGMSFHGLDWSPDGALVAAGGSDGDILLFAAADGQVVDRLAGHADDVAAVAWSPDGSRLASTAGGPRLQLSLAHLVAGPDTTARIWRHR